MIFLENCRGLEVDIQKVYRVKVVQIGFTISVIQRKNRGVMQKIIGIIVSAVVLTGCVVLRPPLSPHRSNTPEHVAAQAVEDCLKCHNTANMPHPVNRGDCLKCHRVEVGE